jgi:hypothetical protein
MSEQQELLSLNQVLGGRFRIVSVGARQDVGTEFKAYDVRLDRLVVVLMVDHRFWAGAEILERLAGARQALADLAEPALLPFEHGGVVNGQLYLVRSRAEGQSLAEVLRQAGSLEARAALEIAIRLCDALAPVHRAGLVHGSLSPCSVFVAGDGRITVTDTGLFPALWPDPARLGRPWGRFPYISPEQAAGQDVHPASDVYVIGSLIYEMLTGRPPFRAGEETILALKHLRSEPPSLQVLVPNLPLPLAQIVHKALAKEPAARYRHAGQLAHILRAQLGPREAPAPPESAAPRYAPPGRQLVVPAPPPSPYAAPAFAEFYTASEGGKRGIETGSEDEGPAGVDWLTIGLIVVALLAVLGLIPLWRTVYRRYAVPPSSPTPISYRLAEPDTSFLLPCGASWANRAMDPAKLDDSRVLGYNRVTLPGPSAGVWLTGHDGQGRPAAGGRFLSLGVQITALGPHWVIL